METFNNDIIYTKVGPTVSTQNPVGATEVLRKKDNVNHPAHYTQGGIECIDALKAATVGKTGIEAICVGNVIKYLWRYEEKNGLEDVEKARWYLERLLEEVKLRLEQESEELEETECETI